MFANMFRKNSPLGVVDADDEAAILDAIVEKTQAATAAVAAVEKQPEPEPAPVVIDPAEAHTQAELQEVRDMALRSRPGSNS